MKYYLIVKEVNNMAGYLALQIIKGKLTYDKVMSKFSKYKEQIDVILIAKSRENLISE